MRFPVTVYRSQRAQFWFLVGCFVVASLLIILVAWDSRFDLSNVDGISYISLARQYASGSFSTALNAYWSPLISWLMAPFEAIGIDGQPAFVIVNAAAAIIGMGFGCALVWWYGGKHFWATAIFLLTYFLFAATGVTVSTPDLLVATWIMLFVFALAVISARMHESSWKQRIVCGVILGALCAVGYFTKLFLVPVFVVVLIIWVVIRAFAAQRRAIDGRSFVAAARPALATVGVAAIVLVILSAPWVGGLTAKYHEFTVGSSFAVNVDKKFDPNAATATGDSLTLFAPPNSKAISFGEDRTYQVAADPKSAHTSLFDRAVYYGKQRLDAFPFYIGKISSIAPFSTLIIFLFALALVFRVIRYRENRMATYAAIVWGVYFLGYAAVTSKQSGGGNSRYYWPLFVLSNLVAVLVLSSMWKRLGVGFWRKALILFLVALLPLSAILEFGVGRAAPFSIGPSPVGLTSTLQKGAVKPIEQQIAEADLSKVIPAGSRIVGTDYRQSLKFAYYLHSSVYGRADQGYDISDPRFQAVLRKNHIDYYLLFTQSPAKVISLDSLGTVVQSTSHHITCSDDLPLLPAPCNIEVIKISYPGTQ